jgi:hypothetical protein
LSIVQGKKIYKTHKIIEAKQWFSGITTQRDGEKHMSLLVVKALTVVK